MGLILAGGIFSPAYCSYEGYTNTCVKDSLKGD